ncbi:unnamed protein product [Orchesella dallaii]|uniref:Uncharacterized protein n=1 Tax=Orchesella dallaii TaxID=48710 RepID=A0ABP1RSC3_9HEXA
MVIFHRFLTTVIILGITILWGEVAVGRGHEFQQDPSHPDSSSKKDSPLFIDPDAPDYPTRDAPPPPRKPQSITERNPKPIPSSYVDTAIIPWKTRKLDRPGRVSKAVTTMSTTRKTASTSTSATPSPVSQRKIKTKRKSTLPPTLNTTITSTESSYNDDPLNGLVEEFVYEEGDSRDNERRRRGLKIYDRHGFMFSDGWFFRTTGIPPKLTYGECVTGYGFENNKYCSNGEVCVDKETLQPVDCPATCAPCTAGGTPPDPCAAGCKPGAGCEDPSPDGICTGNRSHCSFQKFQNV